MTLEAYNIVRRYKLALTIPRPSYLPPEVRGKDPLVPEGTDLAIWTWEDKGRVYGIAFQGKSNKPLWNYTFRSEDQRKRTIEDLIESRRRTLKNKSLQQEERKTYQHPYKVDDILETSYGYDETHVQFYQVIELRGKMIIIRPIASKTVREEKSADYVIADKDSFTGPPVKVLPTLRGVKVDGHSASLWDGKPVYETASGWGH